MLPDLSQSDDDEDAMSADEANGSTTSSNPTPVLPTIVQVGSQVSQSTLTKCLVNQ